MDVDVLYLILNIFSTFYDVNIVLLQLYYEQTLVGVMLGTGMPYIRKFEASVMPTEVLW